MKRRVWPIGDTSYQAMFHRIDMHIIHMRPKIGIVANQMFPISPLPDSTLAPSGSHGGHTFGFRKRFGKPHLDQSPARCEISVAAGQFDHSMQMVGQNHPAMYPETVPGLYRWDHLPEHVDMADQQIIVMSPQQIDRKKAGSAWMSGAAVVRHFGVVWWMTCGAMPFGYCALRSTCSRS